MVNSKGGKGYKRSKKNNQAQVFEVANEDQFYARVQKKLGDKRYEIFLQGNPKKVTGKARGSLKGHLKQDDIILVSGRDFRTKTTDTYVQDVYDILVIYTNEQVRKLIRMGQITDPTFIVNESNIQSYNAVNFDENEEGDDLGQQRSYDMPSSSESEEELEDLNDEEIEDI